MENSGYNEIADLALRKTGQVFGANHRYLVEARLAPILRRENFSDLDELAQCLVARPNPAFEAEVASALTGKDTSFFRDRKALSHIISFLDKRRSDASSAEIKQRILCAGGGSGQEAYSLVMQALDEAPELLDAEALEIVSVDICKATTMRASAGHYGHYEIQTGLSATRMLKYFSRSDNSWQAGDILRKNVTFIARNLIDGVTDLGDFDAVLCRNVLPALARPIAINIAENLVDVLKPWGQLILGEDEALPTIGAGLEPSRDVRNAYRPVPAKPPRTIVA